LLTPPPSHFRELREFVIFLALFGALAAETFLIPQTASLRPWIKGEALPIVRLVDDDSLVLASDSVDTQASPSEYGTAVATISETTPPTTSVVEVPESRGVARGVPLQVPAGSMDSFFRGLRARENGGRTVRVLHWGDSTIAADGVAGTVRRELQSRFGDAGPGFLPASVDIRWVFRPNIARWQRGDWDSHNIAQGGLESARYGLAGAVANASSGASVVLGGEEQGGVRSPTTVFDLFYQERPNGGDLIVTAGGYEERISTSGPRVVDRFHLFQVPEGVETWRVEIEDGGAVIYGAALEGGELGLTWETLGVAGSSVGSMMAQSPAHIQGQVERRDPDLVVYQTGGNSLQFDSFVRGNGERYFDEYVEVFTRLRAGAPNASCLVVAPLDQGVRARGRVESVSEIPRMVELQRLAAGEMGCAFWSAFSVMEGGFPAWMAHEPTLTWSDLVHLSEEGRELVGLAMTDAILMAYDQWLTGLEGLPNPMSEG
jgi:lysophospholipase L1-like esterase